MPNLTARTNDECIVQSSVKKTLSSVLTKPPHSIFCLIRKIKIFLCVSMGSWWTERTVCDSKTSLFYL